MFMPKTTAGAGASAYSLRAATAREEPRELEHTLDPARLGDHLDRLYRAAWALCGSREDAEDLVQETYARLLARPRLLRKEDDLRYLLPALPTRPPLPRNEDALVYLLRPLPNTFLNQKRTESRPLRPGPLPDEIDLVA